MDEGEASSSMTLASLGASFTDIRINSTSTFLIPLPYATWIWSAVNGASCQYCFLPFSPMVCVCVVSGCGTCGPRARALAASMFSCMCHVSLTSPSLQSTSCGQGPSRSPRPSLSGPRRPPSRENVIMVVRKDQICGPRPPVSQCDDVALAS